MHYQPQEFAGPRTVIDKRSLILVKDQDGHYDILQGVLLGPTNMSEDAALRLVDAAYFAAKEACSDEWGFDDVFNILKPQGFIHLSPTVWNSQFAQK